MRSVVGVLSALALLTTSQASATGFSPNAFFSAEWSPDSTAVLVHARAPQAQVQRVTLEGQAERVADVETPAHLSARGELAYVARQNVTNFVGALTIRDAAGRARVVAQAFEHYGLAWSPGGDRIAFRAASGRLAVVGRDGSGRREYAQSGWDPSWSPDGNLIAYSNGVETSVLDVGSGSSRVVGPRIPGIFERPSAAWSPDSSRLALFLNPDVQIVRADGTGAAVRIPGALFPSWSPGGDELAVQLEDDIVVVGADGSGRRTVIASAMRETRPAWSPDGRWIAYANVNISPPGQAYQAGHASDVYLVRPDGNGRRSLTGGCGMTPETPLDWLCVVNGRWSIPISAARSPRVSIQAQRFPRAIKIPIHVTDAARYVYGARIAVAQVSGPRVRVTTMWKKPPRLLSDTGGRAAFRFLKPSRRGTVVLRVTAAGTTRLIRIRV